jgi:drug/metabolite transporter (DMT)-like permease
MQLNPINSKTTVFSLPSLILIAPFFLWGTAMVAMKGVMDETTPLFIATFRLIPAGILLLVTATILGRPQPKSLKAWLWIGLFALIDGTMFQGFLAEGLMKTNAGLGSVIIDSQPLAVALLSGWLFGEIIGIWGALGLAIGILGISLIGLPDQLIFDLFQGNFSEISFTWSNLLNSGELFMLFASLSMAVGTILIRFVTRHVDPLVATGWHMILGGIPLFILSGCFESSQFVNLSFNGWLSLIYSTIFGGAIAYGVFFYLATKGNLTSLSALTFLTPIFALLFGNLLLDEVLSPLQWFGVSLTLVSIYLINQREQITKQFQLFINNVSLTISHWALILIGG